MSKGKGLTFNVHPDNESDFMKIKSEFLGNVNAGKRISPKLAKQFWELLNTETDPVDDSFTNLFLQYIKAKTAYYFNTQPDYWFRIKKGDVEYSLDNWLFNVFDDLKGQIKIYNDRKELLCFIAENLRDYCKGVDTSLSHYKICVVAGYIGSMFGHLNSKEVHSSYVSSYGGYHSYLYKQVNSIWLNKQ